MQEPVYGYMPEWLNVDGKDENSKTGTDDYNNMFKHLDPLKSILSKYPKAVSIACSGNSSRGGNVIKTDTTTLCSWMLPPSGTSCDLYQISTADISYSHPECGCSSFCKRKDDGSCDLSCTRMGPYDSFHVVSHCEYKPFSLTYVNCTCQNRSIGGHCGYEYFKNGGVVDVEKWCGSKRTVRSPMNDLEKRMVLFFQNSGVYDSLPANEHGMLILWEGGPAAQCSRNGFAYTVSAKGGAGATGLCVYKEKEIIKKGNITSISFSSGTDGTKVVDSPSAACGNQLDGVSGTNAQACINTCCNTSGATKGTRGTIHCDICANNGSTSGQNGQPGSNGSASGDCSGGGSQTYLKGGAPSSIAIGAINKDGTYNNHYSWYMPYARKYLMFGVSGDNGTIVHTTTTLDSDVTLKIFPGQGATMQEMSGNNGQNGGATKIMNGSKVLYQAAGGAGGVGNQKTDSYVLCHYADAEKSDCPKTTVKKDTTVIQATKPKNNEFLTVKMSADLKALKPGTGGDGEHTQSVFDFVCMKRHVDKTDYNPKSDILKDEKDSALCKGWDKIKYLAKQKDTNNKNKEYGKTGAVIIVW